MGALQELISLLRKIDPKNVLYKKKQLASIDKMDDDISKEAAKKAIEAAFKNKHNDYGRKLQLIKSCLYGVDIQPIAIQICKLRFFISLAVEQDSRQKDADNLGILALPNLETKFVAADTLLLLQKPGQATFEDDLIDNFLHQLRSIRNDYFNEHDPDKKRELRCADKKLREEASRALRKAGWSTEYCAAIEHDIYDQHNFVPWFDSAMLFGLKEGYDLVIGNPPYISLQANRSRLGKRYKGCGYYMYSSKGNIYPLFYERGFQLLKRGGLLCFITSNQWMRAIYGKGMREYLMQHTDPIRLMNLGGKIFADATVDTNILLVRNQGRASAKPIPADDLAGGASKNISECKFDEQIVASADEPWLILSTMEWSIKSKMEDVGTPLSDWCSIEIFKGIVTSCDEAFVLNKDKYNNLSEGLRREISEIAKPILRGKDIDRKYLPPSPEQFVLYLYRHFPLENSKSRDVATQAEQELVARYPHLYAYLSQHRPALERRSEVDKYEWYVLHRARDRDKLDKEKIVWPEIARYPRFAWVGGEVYPLGTLISMVGRDLQYLLGILNSRAVRQYLHYTATLLGEAYELMPQSIERIPVPSVEKAGEQGERIADLAKEAIKLTRAGKDVTQIEQEIDEEVFDLYGLNQQEKDYSMKSD